MKNKFTTRKLVVETLHDQLEHIINPPKPTVLTYVPTEYPHKRNDPRTRQILWQEHEVGQIVRQAERDLRASPRCTDDERKKRYMNLGSGAAHFTTNRKSGSEERLRTVTRLRPPPLRPAPPPLASNSGPAHPPAFSRVMPIHLTIYTPTKLKQF